MQTCVNLNVNAEGAIDRRGFLRRLAAGSAAFAGLRWSDGLSAFADQMKKQGRSCILLWMNGGPSQFETFDPKPGSESQGPTKAISTSVSGIQIAEHWTHTAAVMKDVALIRSMTGKEGNHGRAVYLLHTSYPPSGGIVHPGFGSVVAKKLGPADFDLPHFVSISGPTVGSSFLDIRYAPFVVTNPNQAPDNLNPLASKDRLNRRLDLYERTGSPAR